MLSFFYESWLYDLWLEFPPIYSPGFATALVVAGLSGYLCFVKLRVKTWLVFLKSLAVGLCCFAGLLIFAVIGILLVGTGNFGITRSWESFASEYVWGVLIFPLLTFFLSLVGFALTNHSRGTR